MAMNITYGTNSDTIVSFQNMLVINRSYEGSTRGVNRSYISPEDIPFIPIYIYVVVSALNAIIFICGIIGNLLVVLVIAQSRNMRTPTNFFLLSLSIADMLVLLFCQPAALMEFYAKDRWLIGNVMCK